MVSHCLHNPLRSYGVEFWLTSTQVFENSQIARRPRCARKYHLDVVDYFFGLANHRNRKPLYVGCSARAKRSVHDTMTGASA